MGQQEKTDELLTFSIIVKRWSCILCIYCIAISLVILFCFAFVFLRLDGIMNSLVPLVSVTPIPMSSSPSQILSPLPNELEHNEKTQQLTPEQALNASNHPRRICNCSNSKNLNQLKNANETVLSSCSDEATSHGPWQRVVSYSLYSSDESRNTTLLRYRDDLEGNLKEVRKFYPGWLARVYTNIPPSHDDQSCELICKHSDILFWCDVNNIPGYGDKTAMVSGTWRFLPLGDPYVSIFVSRNLDSQISERERNAVSEWEVMRYVFHSMRDNPFHCTPMLGGMWGAKNIAIAPDRSKELQTTLIHVSETKGKESYTNFDHSLLTDYVYKYWRKSTLAHDSYLCDFYEDGLTLSFPTKREGGTYVGCFRNMSYDYPVEKCPEQCKPSYGQDWEYC